MNEHDQIRIMEYLDGRLSDVEATQVEEWLRRDDEARRLADEHRRLWTLLGEAARPPGLEVSADFRRDTVERAVDRDARSPFVLRHARFVSLMAASVLIAVGLFAWMDRPLTYRLTDEERQILLHLDLLENLDVLEEYGNQLDLAVDVDILQAFDGEGPNLAAGVGLPAGMPPEGEAR